MNLCPDHSLVAFSLLDEWLEGRKNEMGTNNDFEITGSDGKALMIRTGFGDLDDLTGGFFGGDLVLAAGSNSADRSTFLLDIARCVAREGAPVLLFSSKAPAWHAEQQLLCTKAGLEYQQVVLGDLGVTEASILAELENNVPGSGFGFEDAPIDAAVEICLPSCGCSGKSRGGLIIVESLDLVERALPVAIGRRSWEAEEYLRALKGLAVELDAPILVGGSLCCAVDMREGLNRPAVSALPESASLEQIVDIVMLLNCPPSVNGVAMNERQSTEPPSVIVARNRHGKTGTVPLPLSVGHPRKLANPFESCAGSISCVQDPRESCGGIADGLRSIGDLVNGLAPGAVMVVGAERFQTENLLAHIALTRAEAGIPVRFCHTGWGDEWPRVVMVSQMVSAPLDRVAKRPNGPISEERAAEARLRELGIAFSQPKSRPNYSSKSRCSNAKAIAEHYETLKAKTVSPAPTGGLEIASYFDTLEKPIVGFEEFCLVVTALKQYAEAVGCVAVLGADLSGIAKAPSLGVSCDGVGMSEANVVHDFWDFAEQNIDLVVVGGML